MRTKEEIRAEADALRDENNALGRELLGMEAGTVPNTPERRKEIIDRLVAIGKRLLELIAELKMVALGQLMSQSAPRQKPKGWDFI